MTVLVERIKAASRVIRDIKVTGLRYCWRCHRDYRLWFFWPETECSTCCGELARAKADKP